MSSTATTSLEPTRLSLLNLSHTSRSAARPLIASIRLIPAPMLDSPSTYTAPTSPVRPTCVPPHTSKLNVSPLAISTSRTRSSYRSPKKASAPRRIALLIGILVLQNPRVLPHLLVYQKLHLPHLVVSDLLDVREVEAQTVGGHQRTSLADVRAEHLSKRRVQHMSGRVIASRVIPPSSGPRTHRPSRPCSTVP